ncbi:MAG: glycerate kinase [Methylococcales bacterium]|nr:glycerate kinase [Methylococcales bacterium]
MSPANPTTLSSRKDALSIFQAGIAAADPYQAVKKCLFADDGQLEILLNLDSKAQKRTGKWSKVHLIAFGKAACAMAKASQEIIPAHLLADFGIAVTNYENVTTVEHVEVIGASHPLPDEAGLNAALKCADRISHAQEGELVLVLVSGGGSALIPCPVDSITLQEKIATTDLLLACGATINQINCVRKHLSQLKGGGLAKLAAPADLHALVLSDVLGDDLSAIASGPTVPDNTTYADAINVFNSKGIWDRVSANVRHHLEQGELGKIPETPKPGDNVFKNTSHTLIGSNAISVNATLKAAQDLGYEAQLYNSHLTGEVRNEAEKWALYAKHLIDKGIDKSLALLAGGETTVTLKGNGRGGRNQEMALAFAIAAQRHRLNGDWAFLSGGTDGRDGPTDAAGGLVDQDSIERMLLARIDPAAALDDNDSYTALRNSQDLLDTGATGTNVADLQILLIHPNSYKHHS